MKKIFALFVAVLLFPGISFAEPDAWTRLFEKRNLFDPHADNCDPSTEAFVAVGFQGDGFCIEKTQRSALAWEEARQVCASLDKRLQEFAEYKYACTRAVALSFTPATSVPEWASNDSSTIYETSPSLASIMGKTVGLGRCDWGGLGYISNDHPGTYAVASLPYRCVR